MALQLNIYKQTDMNKPVATGSDADGAIITGLAAGTVVADGDYQATHTDLSGTATESDPVPVTGFTVLTSK